MSAVPTEIRYPPDDLLAMPDGHRFELIDGNLVERNLGAESSLVASRLIQRTGPFAEENELGMVFATDGGYRIFYPESRTVLVYRSRTDVTRLGEDDQLSGEDVLPGFTCRVADCFPPGSIR